MTSQNLDHRPPFFVVGCGRSGTTLVRTMLNKHPLLAVPLETYCIIDYLKTANIVGADRIWRFFPKEHEIDEWGIPIPVTATEFDGTMAERIDRFHMDALLPEATPEMGWGQKTPRFVRFMDTLSNHWPDSLFIHVVRDPRAVVNSLIRSEVHRSNALFATRRWLRDVLVGLDFAQRHPDKVLRVHYETLVAHPEETLEQVCAFLGVSYDPAMLNYQDAAREAYNSDYYKNVHSNLSAKPKADRAESWRKELAPTDLALIETLCVEHMHKLGYETVTAANKLPLSRYMMCLLERPFGFLGQVYHMMKTRRGYARSWIVRKTIFGAFIFAARLGVLGRS